MIPWRANKHTNGTDENGLVHSIVAGTVVHTRTEPGLKETVYFVCPSDLQLLMNGDIFRRDFDRT